MRDAFLTPFWRAAFESLPPAVQHRHASQLLAAERFELTLDAAIGIFSRVRRSIVHLLPDVASPPLGALMRSGSRLCIRHKIPVLADGEDGRSKA